MKLRDLLLLPVIAVLIAAGALVDPRFLSPGNVLDVLHRHSELALLVLAGAVVLIAGRIDLSLESTAGLAPALGVAMVLPAAGGGLGTGLSAWLAIPLCLLAGVAVGACIAVLVLQFRLPAFAVTLGMLVVLRGVHVGLTEGAGPAPVPASLTYLGSARWLGLPASLWICVVLFAAGTAFFGFFQHGRAVYATGGNIDAARAAGVHTKRVLWIVLVSGSALAAFAGMLMAGRLGSIEASATQSPNMIFMVLAAAMIGGVGLSGGRGTLFGALCGVLVIAFANAMLTAAGVGAQWLSAVHGAIILGALALSRIRDIEAAR